MTFDQLYGPYREDIEFGLARFRRKVRAGHDRYRRRRYLQRQCPGSTPRDVAVEVLDPHFFEPASLHDAGDAGGVAAVALVDLHLEHRLMARI